MKLKTKMEEKKKRNKRKRVGYRGVGEGRVELMDERADG